MDVIAAIATGASPTAIGIVRVSGEGSFALCDAVFRPANGRPFSAQDGRMMVFGEMLDTRGRCIDRGLAVRFPGPHSYTGEDSAEFYCHGSPVVLRELLSALFAAGARQAGPGEFTRRAFLNGRLDLTEAEAVVDLIDAETAAAARNAAAQLHGALRRDFEAVTERLLDITSRFYAVVDYPDEDIQDIQPQEIRQALRDCDATLSRLLDTCGRGRILKSGVRTAIIGRPNAGKSSLLNALAGYERCLVTDIPGTTRDTVEESVLCGGVRLRLIDTAGIRETHDAIESIGIERTFQKLDQADIVLWMIDAADASLQIAQLSEKILPRSEGKQLILVFNKADLLTDRQFKPTDLPENVQSIFISAKKREHIDKLQDLLIQAAHIPSLSSNDVIVTNIRHYEALTHALESIHRVQEGLSANLSGDFISQDLRECIFHLSDIVGEVTTDQVLGNIFERFCIGK